MAMAEEEVKGEVGIEEKYYRGTISRTLSTNWMCVAGRGSCS